MSAAQAVAEAHDALEANQLAEGRAQDDLLALEQRLADGDGDVTGLQLAEARAEIDRRRALVAGDLRRLELAQTAEAAERAEEAKLAFVAAYETSEDELRVAVANALSGVAELSAAAERHASKVQLAGAPLRASGLSPGSVGVRPITPSPADLIEVVGAVEAIRLQLPAGLVYPPAMLDRFRALLP
ncbi:MAG: hypothetical protein WB565_00170 [Acidimicrobiales bacterium]